jgi:restriction system protein
MLVIVIFVVFFLFFAAFISAASGIGIGVSILLVLVFLVVCGVIAHLQSLESDIRDKEIADLQEKRIRKIALEYKNELSKKRMQMLVTDDYGDVDDSKWRKEMEKFFNNKIGGIPSIELFQIIDDVAAAEEEILRKEYSFQDDMTGIEYEHYCANILKNMNWDTKVLKASGDQGVDILASKNGKTFAIQCKKYSSPVDNKAVQEVVSGRIHYGADLAAVVTNNNFTRSARSLAKTSKVALVHHTNLKILDSFLTNNKLP